MKFFLGLLIGLALAVGIATMAVKSAWGGLTDISVDDDGATRAVELAGFDRIEVAGVFEIDVTVGEDFAVELAGAQDALEQAKAHVEDGVLILDSEEDRERMIPRGVKATISLPALAAIDAAGIVEGDVRGVKADAFSADVSGIGELALSGSCASFDADVSGIGDLDASGLRCDDVEIEVSGIGEASVYARNSVDAAIGGIGKIEVLGSPENVSKSKTPFSRISVK